MVEPVYLETLRLMGWLIAYVTLAVAILAFRQVKLQHRLTAFAVLNVLATYGFFFDGFSQNGKALSYVVLLAACFLHWLLLWGLVRFGRKDWFYWFAFATPLALMVVYKAQSTLALIGVSFMAFRMAQTAFEIQARTDLVPGFFEYFGFLLSPLTLSAGPINTFRNFHESVDGAQISRYNMGWGAMRAVIGLIKISFLAPLAQQLTFSHIFESGFSLSPLDYLVCSIGFYLYLYLNFSGYTDAMVGLSAFMGIKVTENFDSPLSARNVMDFWRRWHMSLTNFVRDAFAAPLMLSMTRRLGAAYANLAVVIGAIVSFTVLALWHGTALGFFMFYGAQLVGFLVNHFHDVWLRSRGRGSRAAYLANPYIKFSAQTATFLYMALTLSFLELESWEKIAHALSVFR
jgi:D-alanyl-lipoteichoic acid acyltransferase DltB (MBOAT superfamily)